MLNTMACDDRRRFHRILYNADAILTINNNPLPCQIVDLSLKGCLLQLDHIWSGGLDQNCLLTLKLSAEDGIAMQLTITHVDGARIGLKCQSIDIDSICNLRRLVELNLGDSEILERDFSALSEFAPN